MTFDKLPLEFYADKIARREAFTLQLWGDGEFMVASGRAEGRIMQSGEVARPWLCAVLREALKGGDRPDVLRGTDEHLLFPARYGGNDVEDVNQHAINVQKSFDVIKSNPPTRWVDGTIFDAAVREGRLGPLIAALRTRTVVVVGHPSLEGGVPFLKAARFVSIPGADASGSFLELHERLIEVGRELTNLSPAYVLCMGLGAIPLAESLRAKTKFKGATFLDLGSTFDVFAGLGGDRGWRREAYADAALCDRIRRSNVEGIE